MKKTLLALLGAGLLAFSGCNSTPVRKAPENYSYIQFAGDVLKAEVELRQKRADAYGEYTKSLGEYNGKTKTITEKTEKIEDAIKVLKGEYKTKEADKNPTAENYEGMPDQAQAVENANTAEGNANTEVKEEVKAEDSVKAD